MPELTDISIVSVDAGDMQAAFERDKVFANGITTQTQGWLDII